MSFIDKMERKLGRYAIPNLTIYLIGGYIIGYVLEFMARTGVDLMSYLTLEPYYILHGQIWRIISWVLTPPSSFDIFTLIMLLLYYQLGTALEQTWGTFKYNLYLFSGILFTFIGALILYGVLYATNGGPVSIGAAFSTYYINLSIFLAFAACYPNMELRLYFLIPVKIKWLAYLDLAVLAYSFIRSGWAIRVVILVSLLNFAIFFFGGMRSFRPSPAQRKRQAQFKRQVKEGQHSGYTVVNGGKSNISKHKCAICGRTELDDPTLEFRFCSQCNGNYEYCQEHLRNHTHKM